MWAELTPEQLATHLAKLKQLWAELETRVSEVRPPEIGNKKPPPAKKGFASDTSKSTGLSKRAINRAIARAEQVCQEARDVIRGTKLDTAKEGVPTIQKTDQQ